MTFQELKNSMCETEAYDGHPDNRAVDVSSYREEKEVIDAIDNPEIRYGRGHVLPDGVWMFPGGGVGAFETV